MDPEEVLKLFDSCWFNLEIFKMQPSPSNSETNPDHQIHEQPSKPKILRLPTLHVRSMSDQLTSKTSFISGSLSPDSVSLTPKLQTIVSGKEVTGENSITQQVEEPTKKVTGMRRKKKGETKSMSDLEFEELKGFMDLGFVFSEEDKDSSLVEIIPGLQRLGKKDGEEESSVGEESAVSRPYLSEAWEVLDRRKKQNPLMNWRVPALRDEIDMKDNLRWWAHTVASTVR